ncbi:MAG: polysaccharide pyruvyl transferase family protein [Zhongshania sp.]|uniref:polysaccharide pyruvyl transferase family protein n=1 Tax=Zhongshania sp. TaxID=1971902 RepID=UPI00261F514E|nr:polysaccharide pyruvyl transferase family protein [Zhongshania sp.]MDF1690899.1 polysaccharide pyruvyl transferase family protein [Zhongshania sp.]
MSKKPKKSGKKSIKNAVVLPPELQSVFNQALAQHQQGQLQQAVDGYSQVLSHEPNHADSLHLVGLVFQSSGDLYQAKEFISRAIELKPNVAGYHYNFGVVLQGLDQHSEAVDAYRAEIRLNPNNAKAYENLGVALQDLDNLKAALPAYQQALALNHKSLIALTNLGTLYFKNGKTVESLNCFDKALVLNPADPELHMKRSGSLLRMGQWAEGWQEYRWRFNAPTFLEANPVRSFGLLHAEMDAIANQRVLISCEQGLGDEVMFASCVNDVIERAKECTVECDPRVVPMFSRSFPKAKVVAKNDFVANKLDSHIPAGDLPYYFRNIDSDFKGAAYLFANAEARGVWRGRLATLPQPLSIGFSWRGGAETRAVAARSIDLKYWKPLFKSVNANFVNLQYRTSPYELTELNEIAGESLCHFDDLDTFGDIEGLAALISELDLVISADNATVHLAGALGVPVWILLPEGPERRWTDGRDDSVWYDSARIFRSSVTGSMGWPKVFKCIIEKLNNFQPIVLRDIDVAGQMPEALHSVSQNGCSGKRAVLLNDTSDWYHWGCSGTSHAVHSALRERNYSVRGIPIAQTCRLEGLPISAADFELDEVYTNFRTLNSTLCDELNAADVVVINGEGSLHGQNATSIGLLYLAHIAKTRHNKPVHIINHSCYPDEGVGNKESPISGLYALVYQELDFIAIREGVSFRQVRELGVECEQSFDCLPLFIEASGIAQNNLSGDGPIVLAGSVVWQRSMGAEIVDFIKTLHERGHRVQLLVGASAYLAADDINFVQWIQGQAPGCTELYYTATEAEWLSVIANASVLVSGRFHHSIAAAFLGTPFVVCESNTPKIAGLLEMLEMPVALAQNRKGLNKHLMAMVVERESEPSAFLLKEEVREALLVAARNNFSKL